MLHIKDHTLEFSIIPSRILVKVVIFISHHYTPFVVNVLPATFLGKTGEITFYKDITSCLVVEVAVVEIEDDVAKLLAVS